MVGFADFPKTLEAFAALDVADRLGGVSFNDPPPESDDPKAAAAAHLKEVQTGYSNVNSALSNLPRLLNKHFESPSEDTEAAVLEQLQKIPEGYQAVAVQYIRDSLEAGKGLNARPYKAEAESLYYGGEYADKVKQAHVSPETNVAIEHKAAPEPAAVIIQIPDSVWIKAENIPDGGVESHKYIADAAKGTMRAIERGASPEQIEKMIAQFEPYDEGFPEHLQYGPALKQMVDGGSYEAVTNAISHRMGIVALDLSADYSRDQILSDPETVSKIIDGYQFNYEFQEDAAAVMGEELERKQDLGGLSDGDLDDITALLMNPANPMELTEAPDPSRAVPEKYEHMREMIIEARDPEIAKDALVQDPSMSRADQLEKFGMAMVGDEAEMLRTPDGRGMVLWEVKDEVSGGTDFVLRDAGSVLRDYNTVYLDSLDKIGDAQKSGEDNIFDPITGIAEVADDVSASLDKIRTLKPDHDFSNAQQPDQDSMQPAMKAAYARHMGNEVLAEQLEADIAQAAPVPQAAPAAPQIPEDVPVQP